MPSIISKATRRRGVQYSTRDYSELTWVYSKKDTSCVTGKWWPNSILMCIFHICFHYFCPSLVHAARLYSLGWLDKLFRNVSLSVGVLFNSLPCLCSIMLDCFVLLTCFHLNHFLLHSAHNTDESFDFHTWCGKSSCCPVRGRNM